MMACVSHYLSAREFTNGPLGGDGFRRFPECQSKFFGSDLDAAKGVILEDEVGLGKTIEAGLVLCQKWAEKKRRLLVICPARL